MEKSRLTETEKGETGEEQSHNLFWASRGLFIKNSSWQAKQSIPHTAVTLYDDCVKMCEDFAPNFGRQRTGCRIRTHHLTLRFSPGNFLLKTT
jgi:hypothetical protein